MRGRPRFMRSALLMNPLAGDWEAKEKPGLDTSSTSMAWRPIIGESAEPYPAAKRVATDINMAFVFIFRGKLE